MIQFLPFTIIITAGMWYAVSQNKLTRSAAVTGALIAITIFAGTGYVGFVMMTLFFLLGTLATSHKKQVKLRLGLSEQNAEKRLAAQVLANAGVPGLLSIFVLADGQHKEVYFLMIAAAFASATADTMSSEIGSVYGTTFYNILSFKKDDRGRDGVISLEGTLAGLAGSTIIGLLYACHAGLTLHVATVILAGTSGNLFDSLLGATLERSGILKNNGVNFLNTLFAALIALLL